MESINLIYAATPTYGGWVTYTENLYHSFLAKGYSVKLFTIGKSFSKKPRHFSGKVYAHRVVPSYLEEIKGLKVITALDKKTAQQMAQISKADDMIYIVHDPTELTHERMVFYQNAKHVFTPRANMLQVIEKRGMTPSQLPHPYIPTNPTRKIIRNAVCWSRIDWDKGTDIIAGANQILPIKQRCHIYGAENRIYAYHKLDNDYPLWKNNYKGKFPKQTGIGATIAAGANWAVDMSAIQDDGEGVQYTFLEAWDAGTPLIINKKWSKENKGQMQTGVNCIAVETKEELASLLRETRPPKEIIKNGKQELKLHSPENIMKMFFAAI